LWQSLFASLGLSSLLGTLAHGVRMSHTLNTLLWQPLYFFLGLTLTLLAAVAIHDLRGDEVARRFLPWLLLLPFGVVATTWLLGGSFIYFILFEALIMAFALVVYLQISARRQSPGSGMILGGILISIMAAVVQAAGPFTVHAVFLFDHNGLFHLVQMVGVVCFYAGAKRKV
jgi:uncharacterized membrane protein HdeD (DUF308 family)